MNLDLKNKNAIVCGSTQGIGEASAIELAKLGANITLIARNEGKLFNVVNNLDKSHNKESLVERSMCRFFIVCNRFGCCIFKYNKKNKPLKIIHNYCFLRESMGIKMLLQAHLCCINALL